MLDGHVAARHVYILRSLQDPSRTYVGLTTDVRRRLATHNSGGSRATAANRPWALVVSIEFADPNRAEAFEQYLKSGAGRTFAERHLE
jgi:putative endonuclease